MAASSLLDGCKFNPTLGGTADWVYSSAVQGNNSPALANAVTGQQYSYHAQSTDQSQWEDGTGNLTISAGPVYTFARTNVLYNSSGTGSAAGQSGAGTKISFSAAPQVAIVALKEDLNQPPVRALLTITSALNPSGFTNTTGLMLGMGGTCKLTPSFSGSVNVTFFGLMLANGGQSNNLTIRYGTGTAPANAAALTGTIANSESGTAGSGTTSITDLFCTTASITGLTIGTAYWFDLSMRTSGATSQSIAGVGFSAHEF